MISDYEATREAWIKASRRPTFFEVCGYPHYEDVVSNVLAFFFDTSKPHGVRDLCVQSLLEVAGVETTDIEQDWTAEREVMTESGKFIDIHVYNDERLIVVENKIWAPLYNDLRDYADHSRKSQPGKALTCVVLCLSPPSADTDLVDFQPITYDRFFNRLKTKLGSVIASGDLRYVSMLADLIENITYLKEGTSMDSAFMEFLSKHQDSVNRLVKDIKRFRDDLRSRVKTVNDLVPDKINSLDAKRWDWRNLNELYDVAVTDLVLPSGARIAINAILSHQGWAFEIYQRSSQPILDIDSFSRQRGLRGQLTPTSRFQVGETLPYSATPSDVALKISEIAEMITK
ncbi:MAG: PD-(D/E)XK nuclease family protein [Bacteroidota bacterium]